MAWPVFTGTGLGLQFQGQNGHAVILSLFAAIVEKSNYWSSVPMLTHSALVMSSPQDYLLWYFRNKWDFHHEIHVRMTNHHDHYDYCAVYHTDMIIVITIIPMLITMISDCLTGQLISPAA